MADDQPKPARKRAARKTPARKRATAGKVTARDRAKAAEQIASVTPIKGGTTSRPGRANASRNGRGPASPMSPESLAIHARREMAVNLRRMGLQWAQVAATVRERSPGCPPAYNKSDAYNDAKALIDSVTVAAVQETREEDLALLLALQRKVVPAAMDGDLKAVDRALAILDQRAKYLGLYAPTRHELTGTAGGPVALSPEASPREVFDAAWHSLDQALAHVERPALPDPRKVIDQ